MEYLNCFEALNILSSEHLFWKKVYLLKNWNVAVINDKILNFIYWKLLIKIYMFVSER